MPARKSTAPKPEKNKSLESWIWDAACSIRGAKDAPKYKDFILPLIFTKRLCDVFDDELNRIATEVGSRKKAFQLAKRDHKLVLILHAAKPKARKAKVFLVNASQIFEKGNPKDFIPDDGIQRIADILISWQEEEKLSRIVDHAELKKNDYNLSPSRYIHTSDAETYRPLAEIVADLDAIELDARKTDKELRSILKILGVAS